jgi:putative inorganic carbon (hco3(-)) transporter
VTVAAFIGFYLAGLLSAILVDGAFGLYLYQIEYFLNSPNRYWTRNLPDIRYVLVIGITILTAFVTKMGRYRENKFLSSVPMRWWLSLTILTVCIYPVAVWPEMHVRITVFMVKYLAIGFLAFKLIDTTRKFEGLLWAHLTGQLLLARLVWATGRNSTGRVENAGPSDASDANDMAALVAASIPLLMFYLVTGRPWQRALAAVYMAFAANALILINSRGAFIALTFALLYLSYHLLWRVRVPAAMRLRLIGFGIAGLLAFGALADAVFWERMESLLTVEVSEDGALGGADGGATRTEFWFLAFDVVADHPFGAGGFGYNFLSPRYVPENQLSKGGLRAVHSTWFQTLSELGYVGLGVFLCLLYSTFAALHKARKHLAATGNHVLIVQSHALSASLLAFLTAGTFIDRLWAEGLYWILVFSAIFVNLYQTRSLHLEVAKPIGEPLATTNSGDPAHPGKADSSQTPRPSIYRRPRPSSK